MVAADEHAEHDPLELVVYTAHGCCLCDDARAVLDVLGPELDLPVVWRYIDGDAQLEAAWREQLPAGVLAGRKVFKYHVDAALIRRRVAAIRRSRGNGS